MDLNSISTGTISLLILSLSLSCSTSNKPTDVASYEETTATDSSTTEQPEPSTEEEKKTEVVFDRAVIPTQLLDFISTHKPNARIPIETDYDEYYFTGYAQPNQLPFYCYGNFNGDSLTDYALVLLENSKQVIYAFNADSSSYNTFLIDLRELATKENGQGTAVEFNITTFKEGTWTTIDSTYTLATDAIIVNDMYNSRTYLTGWNPKTGKFLDYVGD